MRRRDLEHARAPARRALARARARVHEPPHLGPRREEEVVGEEVAALAARVVEVVPDLHDETDAPRAAGAVARERRAQRGERGGHAHDERAGVLAVEECDGRVELLEARDRREQHAAGVVAVPIQRT